MIPKIIHYCWFGGKEMPQELKDCLSTWDKLKGYEIKRWDESNCSFDENEFVKKAYAEKQWGFVGDYYRLKAVYEYGGIYLDTDVKVHKDFDPILNNKCFMGYYVDCCLCTAIIGAEKGASIISELMHLYDITHYVEDKQTNWNYDEDADILYTNHLATTNYYYTWFLKRKYPELTLKNKYQKFDEITIYPKEYFEIGSLLGRHYTVHLNNGSWRNVVEKKGIYGKIKSVLLKSVFGEWIRIIVRKRRYKKMKKTNDFYKDSKVKNKLK